MKFYRAISLLMMSVFAAVGLLFLFAPNGVSRFFNLVSSYGGMRQIPMQGNGFYLILAVGYMYLVSLLAYLMYRFPENRYFPLILANGKLASSFLSLSLFIADQPYLIYITNCVIDGMIGILVLTMYLHLKKKQL
jgi:hypothetical protein